MDPAKLVKGGEARSKEWKNSGNSQIRGGGRGRMAIQWTRKY